MAGIPPATDTDSEDVAWALQTADALWKRAEHLDALVWLRRAAQAAGEAEDDDRALVLARNAAELAEWVGRGAPPSDGAPPPRPATDDEVTSRDASAPGSVSSRPTVMPSRAPTPAAPAPAMQLTSIVPTLKPGRLTSLPPPLPMPPRVRSEESASRPEPSAPTAAQAHAGMLDPWAEHEPETTPAITRPSPPPRTAMAPPKRPRDVEEIVTSAPPVAISHLPAQAAPVAQRSTPPVPALGDGGLTDLGVPARWPEAANRALARYAAVRELTRDEEVSGFALVSVIEGSVDIAATIVDAPAERLEPGSVLRARGSIEAVAPLRAIAASERARVATWTEKEVTQAFATCPAVEAELRAAGNRIQALVGATMGPLGERLDTTLRTHVTSRLRLRILEPNEVLAKAGDAVPGLVVVGSGELELLDGQGSQAGGRRTVLRSGDFLFPSEVLRAAAAPQTARAAKTGALLLVADRAVAQELLVTCPPLLEIFAEA